MPDKSERFSRLPNFFNHSGDTLYGYSPGWDGEVAYTKFGEFGVEVSEGGELIASFPEQGLLYIYEQEGDILLAVVDVGVYLSGLPYDQVLAMPNEGKNVMGLVRYMRQERLSMIMTVTLGGINAFKLVVVDEDGNEQVAKDVEEVDYRKGLKGEMGIKENAIAFEVTDSGDDLLIALGERDGKDTNMVGVEASLFVDFEKDVFCEDSKRLQRLAGKIILNSRL